MNTPRSMLSILRQGRIVSFNYLKRQNPQKLLTHSKSWIACAYNESCIIISFHLTGHKPVTPSVTPPYSSDHLLALPGQLLLSALEWWDELLVTISHPHVNPNNSCGAIILWRWFWGRIGACVLNSWLEWYYLINFPRCRFFDGTSWQISFQTKSHHWLVSHVIQSQKSAWKAITVAYYVISFCFTKSV